ncbi:MAG: NAD(P)/FAD-dependent oxidoreductase [Pseudomonadales bacterium]|nr:NAD(P)/FAD-dependent oxidoreductase [Pseudomonadales bacterium]
MSDSALDLGFDPDELRQKYRTERDKRIRDDGNQQYQEVEGEFAHYVEDPYVGKEIKREPLTDVVEVAIIGGGFGGLLAGAKLREQGVKDIRMIEKGADFGGTWYWNRYPGAACDIESYVYLPLLEELDYMPKRKFSDGAEILAHSQAIGRHYNLYDNACFQTEVTEMHWDDESSMWTIHTNQGDRMKARFVAMSNGPLNRPKLPGIPGIETYKGHSFHTSRWDYGYTGGDSSGNLTGLEGKRVGVLGTGATAVQCVPHIGAAAKELYVFQRTPSSIDVRNDQPTDQEWVNSLEPGWHQHRMDNFNTLVSGGVTDEDLVNDGWTEIIRNLLLLIKIEKKKNSGLSKTELAEKMELADFQKMQQVRARADTVVNDSETAEALKPYYRQFCKRPCFHDEYLQSFNRSNVTLVDTQGQGVERITEKGVVANGKEYEIDCLVFATGFEVGTEYARRSGFEVYGRDGQSLTERWEDGVETLHGMHSRGFPNCFIMGGGAQTGFTANYPHALNEQAKHLSYIIRHALDGNYRVIEASEEAQAEWVETIVKLAHMGQRFYAECTPGYYNNEGRNEEKNAKNSQYGGNSMRFFELMENWRNTGDLKGLELT